MANQWFRMYADFLDDPKMVALAFEDQRHFIGVLALKSLGSLDSDCDPSLLNRIVAQKLWVDLSAISEVKKRLVVAGLIDDNWQPLAWGKRQFVSDHDMSGAERQRKYREAKRNALCNVTGNSDSNAPVTLPEQNITEQNITNTSPAKLPTCPVELIVKAYHEILPELPGVRMMDDGRKKAIKDRWKWVLTTSKPDGTPRAETGEQATDWFKAYFERARDNDFLMGKTIKSPDHKDWKPDIDYLMTTKGLKQVIEKTGVAA